MSPDLPGTDPGGAPGHGVAAPEARATAGAGVQAARTGADAPATPRTRTPQAGPGRADGDTTASAHAGDHAGRTGADAPATSRTRTPQASPGRADGDTTASAHAGDHAGRTGADTTAAPEARATAGGGGGDGGSGPAPRGDRFRARRRVLRPAVMAVCVLGVLGAGAMAATGVVGGHGAGGGAQAGTPSALDHTAAVRRATLTRGQTVDGTLGYGDTTAVQPAVQPGGRSAGTVTWLPAEGATLTRGKPVYRVDEQDVPLLYGKTPLYRRLAAGSEGDDVEELERNLAALGYTGFTADGTYTDATAAAVKEWQDDLGRPQTGTVAPGDAVIASGARRVAHVTATAGAPLTGEVLDWTGTERGVTVDLDTAYADLVKVGAHAEITLPDGTTAAATVTSVGTAATAEPGSGSGGAGGDDGSGTDATLPVELSVKDQKALGGLQAAPVDVELTAERRSDVLAVPVEALIALPGGGYAVQTAGPGGTVRNVPVRTGMFAQGLVEVSGAGVHAGLAVGVPR